MFNNVDENIPDCVSLPAGLLTRLGWAQLINTGAAGLSDHFRTGTSDGFMFA